MMNLRISQGNQESIDLSHEIEENGIEMSRCGHLLIGPNNSSTFLFPTWQLEGGKEPEKIWNENIVSYEEICKNPDTIFDPSIIFRIGKKYIIIFFFSFFFFFSLNTVEFLESIHGLLLDLS
jgi:hypothetical protein